MLTAAEIKAALEEDAEGVAEAFKEAGFLPESSVQTMISTSEEGLKKKNRELLGKIKEFKDKSADTTLQDNHKRLVDVLADHELGIDDPANVDYDKIEEALDGLISKSGKARDVDPQELISLRRDLTKVTRERERFERELQGKRDEVASLTQLMEKSNTERNMESMDRQFTKALSGEGYPDYMVELLVEKLKRDSKAIVEVDEDTGTRQIVTDDGKAVKEWVKDWATTDIGKTFKTAPNNSGGGASGGGSGSGKPKSWKNMTIGERNELVKTNPTLARRLMAQRT